MPEIKFENISMLGWMVVIPIAIFCLIYFRKWQKTTREIFADSNLIPLIFSNTSKSFYWVKAILLILTLFFIVLALLGPMWGREPQTMKREGIDMVFALDVSTSMYAEDVAPNRLEKAKNFIRRTMKDLGGDRVGLVVFAGDAYAVSPLTNDYSAIDSYLQSVSPELFWNQGTNTAEAIRESIQLLGKSPDTSKAIILISDGEDHEENLNSALSLAQENKVKIITVGVGGNTPVPIPIYDNGYRVGYKDNENGNPVLTKLQPQTLTQIAQKTDGAYIKMNGLVDTVKQVESDLATLKKKSESETTTMGYKNRYQWPLALAILGLFIYTLTLEKRFFNR